MARYAVVMTADAKLIPGVNAVLNAMEYYGNSAEFHLLYWDGKGSTAMSDFCQSAKATGKFPLFHPVDLRQFVEQELNEELTQKAIYYLKFYRHIYPWKMLQDYDAVAIFDADMALLNNIDWYFDISDKTGKILIPNNSHSKQHWDSNSGPYYRHACNPPLHSMPLFFKPAKHSELLRHIPQTAIDTGTSEMPAINHVLISNNMMGEIIVLPNVMWLQTEWSAADLSLKWIETKRYLAVAKDDRICSIHGRWWLQTTLDKKLKNRDSKTAYVRNIKLFLDCYQYFNTECYHRLKWEWGVLHEPEQG